MGKFLLGFVFLICAGSLVSAQEVKDEVIPYNLKAALKSVLNIIRPYWQQKMI